MSVRTEDLKRWAMIKFRAMLRGKKLTEQFERWAVGELGRDYLFRVELRLNDEAATFVSDSANRAQLDAERLDDASSPPRGARGTGR